jgi:hypothetical protein
VSKREGDEQRSSDGLPYSQVHRTAKPKATLLAGAIKVTPQHALGSLVEFWDLCAGDQRDLEAIIEKTPAGQQPAIVLTEADILSRFELASGHRIEPVKLVQLGLAEKKPGDQYRVRGMSRYFEPVLRKITLRDRASAGGRKSAARRAEAQAALQPPAQAGAQAGASTKSKSASSSEQLAVSSKKKEESNQQLLRAQAKKTAQVELPAEVVPPKPTPAPKAPNLVAEVLGYFDQRRTEKLRELGVDPEKCPDDPPNFARSGATINAWAKAVHLEDDPHYVELHAIAMIEKYLADPWPSGLMRRDGEGKDTAQPQPYPWHVLLSEKLWRKYHEQLEAELDQRAGGAH